MSISVDEIAPIFEKIKDRICDQDAGIQVICVVEIYSNKKMGARTLITPAEYLKLVEWLKEKGINYSENKNGVDTAQVKKLFMEVVEDHWLVFHCPKRVLIEHFAVQPSEPKAASVAALGLS